MKKCSIFSAIREMKVETTLKFYFIPVRMASVRTSSTAREGRRRKKGEREREGRGRVGEAGRGGGR
jgi:hypothetical protein